MRTATMRDLRTRFSMLARWMDNGELIEITRRGRVIAHLTRVTVRMAGKARKPNIMKRLRKIYGDYVMPDEEVAAILSYTKGRY